MMKKLLPGLFVMALFTASCQKDSGSLPDNSWSVAGKKFEATIVRVDPSLALVSAVGGNNSLDVTFKSLPTASADFTVSDEPYTSREVAVKSILSGGSIVYNSVESEGSYVAVRVTNGKYTVLMNEIVAVNVANAKDTVRISANIVEN